MIVKVIGVPLHPESIGVTVIVLTIGKVPEFVAVKLGKLPVPLAPSPIAVLLFVQLKVAPAFGELKVVTGTIEVAQCV